MLICKHQSDGLKLKVDPFVHNTGFKQHICGAVV